MVDISFVAMLLSYMPCPFQLSCINRNIYVITADRGTWMSFGCHSYTPQDQWRRSVESRQQSENVVSCGSQHWARHSSHATTCCQRTQTWAKFQQTVNSTLYFITPLGPTTVEDVILIVCRCTFLLASYCSSSLQSGPAKSISNVATDSEVEKFTHIFDQSVA